MPYTHKIRQNFGNKSCAKMWFNVKFRNRSVKVYGLYKKNLGHHLFDLVQEKLGIRARRERIVITNNGIEIDPEKLLGTVANLYEGSTLYVSLLDKNKKRDDLNGCGYLIDLNPPDFGKSASYATIGKPTNTDYYKF